jgi:hypothetical protein
VRSKFGIAGAIMAALCVTTSVEAQSSRIPGVRIVSSLVLADAAVAIADSGHPVIYINPRVFEEVGSEMAAFLLAHEEGHIALGHSRIAAANLSRAEADRVLTSFERDADCYAARSLASHQRAAALSAVAWFRSRGSWRPDEEHPIGYQRATIIESCLAAADWARGGAVGR